MCRRCVSGLPSLTGDIEKSPHSAPQSLLWLFVIPITGSTVSRKRSVASRSDALMVTWSNTPPIIADPLRCDGRHTADVAAAHDVAPTRTHSLRDHRDTNRSCHMRGFIGSGRRYGTRRVRRGALAL